MPDGRHVDRSAEVIEGYRLLGLVTAGPTRRAWLAEGTRNFEIGEGDMLEGWTVQRIEQNRLVLSSPAGEAVPRFPPIVPRFRICGPPTVRAASARAGSVSASGRSMASA